MRRFTLPTRRALRRAYRGSCDAISLSRFSTIGDTVLDLSPRGMLVALDDDGVAVNDVVAVRFELPGGFEVNAEAEVARVIRGRRDQDVCMAAGLAFTRLPMNARHEILVRLAGTPPPVPGRSLRLGVAPLAVRTPKGPFSAAGGPARRS